MMKMMGAKPRERKSAGGGKKWWKFSRKTKVKPMRQLTIEHNVDLPHHNKSNVDDDDVEEVYEMSKYLDRDNNHYR